ncbi:PREDICTED: protein TIME FOR COFFEE-like isoform X1 [Camelina sativa]|uniref:Protein TIME FOR COFFEE-like isoform X1 n=2 Tax=Camelina sativa TaxID=90675 RepID=A0ABM0UFF4_CAMSA|nr:PREDICTED: protein TIME FOR COFFEE-like isoform X1 [Camelina sativa]
MERNREARRVPMAAAGNGFSTRRRHRAGSFRDSPEVDIPVEYTETARLRDRGTSSKKDRDRERDKGRDRLNSRSKRRRRERGNIDDGGGEDDDDTSEESVNDDEEYDDGGEAMKMLPPAMTNHQRKSFPQSKGFRSSPSPTPSSPIVSSWKAADEMIGVSIPRKARSACTKRPHESWTSGGGVFSSGEKIHRQISSPASMLASPSPPASLSPSSSNVRKKMTPGPKPKPLPPKSPVAVQDEIEIEIAEVLYGMMRQPQGPPSKQEAAGNDSGEMSKPAVEEKSRLSPPVFNSQIATPSAANANSAIAPKRKRPRVVRYEDDTVVSTTVKAAEDEVSLRFTGENLSSTNLQPSTSLDLSSAAEYKENGISKEGKVSPEMESSSGIRSDVTKASLPTPEMEKIEINLMTPSEKRSSPARDGDIECVVVTEPKVTIVESETKPLLEDVSKDLSLKSEEGRNQRSEAEDELQKSERNCQLKLDLEKPDPDNKQSGSDRPAEAINLSLHMSIPSWSGGIPTMGYLGGPTHGIMPTDTNSLLPSTTMQPPHLLFNQPRPKRCATHCYIARNIHYHQQFTKINPFWPATAGSLPLYGSNACNLSLMPSAELQGSVLSRNPNTVPEKSSLSASNSSDTAQRKQILLQQALPAGASNNIMHGPAFIFPLGQQPHAAAAIAAASVRPPNTSNAVVSSGAMAASASVNGPPLGAPAAATAMSFSYPNMPTNETQYVAILQNNGYPFPVPTHVGPPPAYRGVTGQPMPFFNGSFYPSQVVHSPHLPPQQQPGQGQQTHAPSNQNTNASTGSSAAQKLLQNQQRRPPVNSQGFPTQKVQHRQHPRENATQHSETAREASPSTTDSRASRSNVSYGQKFASPMQPTKMGLMGSAASGGGVLGSSNNHSERKPEQQGSKVGAESIQSQPYAMTFAAFNGGLNMPSTAQNHAILHGVPEAARQGYHQMMAAAAASQSANHKMNCGPEDGKSGSNASANATEVRKTTGSNGKTATTGVEQSIAFSGKQDSADASAYAVTGGAIIDSSARVLNLGSAQPWSSSSAPTSHQQQHMQRNQPQQQQYSNYLQMQQQYAVAAARGKGPVMSNGSGFVDHNIATTPSVVSNNPIATSGFPQNLVQSGSGSPAQSPQWKNNSPRAQSPSILSPSVSSSLKNVQQKQQGRPHQSHISFAANSKTLPSNSPMQQGAGSNRASSPTASSVSKNAGAVPTSIANRAGHGQASSSSLPSSQPSKNSQSASFTGGRNNGPSILGNPHVTTTTSNPTYKSQQQQQQQQHLQQAQLYFSSPYMQAQHHQQQQQQMNMSSLSGYYIQRQQQQQQQAGSSAAAPSVTLSSCTTVTSDPAKAINMKGGGSNNINLQHTQTAEKTHHHHPQQVPPGFPYAHAGQVKPGDQKQQAGE